jgi:hypothetical protein
MWALWRAKACRRLQLATQGQRATGQHVSPVSLRVQARALLGPQGALCRSSGCEQAPAAGGAHQVASRLLRLTPVSRLRRIRSGGPRVRPPARQGIRDRPIPPIPQLEDHRGGDREVRRRVCELPSAPDCSAPGVCASRDGGHATRVGLKRARGLEPPLKPWKGFVQPLHHARVSHDPSQRFGFSTIIVSSCSSVIPRSLSSGITSSNRKVIDQSGTSLALRYCWISRGNQSIVEQ